MVLQYRLVTSDYFLNHLEEWEAMEMINNIEYADRNEWERTRAGMYLYAQSLSKKKLKPQSIIKFSWDKDEKETDETLTKELSKENKARLQARAEWIKKTFIDNGK